MPRLLLAWLTTEAVRTKQRELELGDSLSSFMRELSMVPTGGRWGSITRLKDQTGRLFGSTVSLTYSDADKRAEKGFRLADESVLWWDPKTPDQASLWKSTVTLSEKFFAEVTERPVPVDMRALRALKKSSLALDIYTTLTHRASYLTKPSTVTWAGLAGQFGSDYAELRDFKKAFIAELRKVSTVYAGVNVEVTDVGLVIKPTLTQVPPKKIKP